MIKMDVSLRKQGFDKRMKAFAKAGGDFREPFREFAQYMRVQTESMFRKLRRGGRHRGVLWKYFSPQYTRKDGTEVPAWGGVERVRAGSSTRKRGGGYYKGVSSDLSTRKLTGFRTTGREGDVRGRLRPSGKRVTQNSALMRDTGTMSGRAALVIANQKDRLVLGPQGVNYAAAQQGRRPFLFFNEPDDTRQLGRILSRHLRKLR